MRHSWIRRLMAPLLVSGLLLAACSSDPAPTAAPDSVAPASEPEVDEPAAVGGEATRDHLEAAREEGTVTWYTSFAGPVVTAMTEAFTAAHPDVEVVVFRSPQTDLVARLIQEHAAGRVEADVIEVNQDAAAVLAEEGVLTGLPDWLAASVDERWVSTGEDGTPMLIADRVSYVGFAYNTDLLDPTAVPRRLEDLASPELAASLAITTSTTGVRWVGSVLNHLGEEAGRDLLASLGQGGLRLEAVSGAGLADLIASGEVTASPAVFRNHVLSLQADGAPIEWVPLEPALGNVGVVAIPEGATRPNAGLLLAEFLLGPDGARVLEEYHYPRPDEVVGFEVWIPDEVYATSGDQQEAFLVWQSVFDEVFD